MKKNIKKPKKKKKKVKPVKDIWGLNKYPLVSVCVLTYDGLEFTKQSLESLIWSVEYPKWELIVVDNGSKDGTVEWLKRFADTHKKLKIKLIFNKKNLGVGRARNLAIGRAKGAILCTADNDMLYEKKGWMGKAVKILQTFPEAAVVGFYGHNIRVLRKLSRNGITVTVKKTVPPGNAVFRRLVWRKIGPFREDVLFKEGRFSGSIFSYELNPMLRAHKLFPVYGGKHVTHLRQKVNIRRPSLRKLRSKSSLRALKVKVRQREKGRRKRKKNKSKGKVRGKG